jgi:hypothetical protein
MLAIKEFDFVTSLISRTVTLDTPRKPPGECHL